MNNIIRFDAGRNPVHEEIQGYALSASLSRAKALNSQELRKFAAGLMLSISDGCFRGGAKDIGHIKAYIEYAGGFLRASTVGDPADITVDGRDADPTERFTIIVNAVIYGLTKVKIEEATAGAFADVVSAFGLTSEPGKTERQPHKHTKQERNEP